MNAEKTERILTLDVGTTSVKACLFDRAMRLTAQAGQEYMLETHESWAEAQPQLYLDAVKQCVLELPATQRAQVCAVALTTQGETLICVDRQGRPLRPAIVWLDSRAVVQAAQLEQVMDRQKFYEQTGLPELTGALPLSKLCWLREQEPDVWAQTDKFLLLEDYLMRWLTGRTVTEKSLLSSTGYFDLRADDYWDDALSVAGVDRARLPEALECGTIVGTLLPERAHALGLPESAQVVTGAMDQTAAAYAAGCVEPGMLCETTGTAMVAAAYTDCPQFSPAHHVTVYRHAMPGAFLYLPISNTVGMALKWFRDEFCGDVRGGYPALDRMAEQVPPGSQGITFLPFLSGCVNPDHLPDATGCFFGLRLSTTRESCVRAVLEAAAFQLRDFLKMLEELGCHAQKVTSLGGGAGSRLWMQIKADVCRRPFRTLHTVQATSLGAAMLAARALAWPVLSAGEETVYLPHPDADYDAAYAAYRRVYEALYLQKG